MSDYAARRDAGIRRTLDAIDAVIPKPCMACGQPVPIDGPSDLYCSYSCSPTCRDQDEWDAATTTAQAAKRHRRAGEPGADPIPAPVLTFDEVPFRLENPIPRYIARQFTRHPYQRFEFTDTGLSINTEILRSLAAATDAIDQETERIAARRAERDHHLHIIERRGGRIMWTAVAALLALGTLFAVDSFWVGAVLVWLAALGTTPFAAASTGNARAAAATCRICHPPCDDDPYTTTA